ncbi:MAG: hypothetical protein CMO01_11765 [Thalassobius sp.]|nr:hypothetical protein [Thalassovita sp.]
MEKCFKVITMDQADDILNKNALKANDFSFQLQTNYAYMFEIDEKWLLIPNHFDGDCILFDSFECYDNFYKNETFPVENNAKDIFEYEDSEILKRMDIHYPKYIEYFKKALNDSTIAVNKESIKKCFLYLKEKDANRKLVTIDGIAFVGVFGEYFRQEKGGKWAYIKRYGQYNPYYEPHIYIEAEGKLISVYNTVFRFFDEKFEKFMHNTMTWGFTGSRLSSLERDKIEYKIFDATNNAQDSLRLE